MFIACIALVLLTGLAAGNMLFRVVYVPIPGSYELIGFLGALAVAFALAFTQIRGGHIIVNIVSDHFSARVNRVLDQINYAVNTIFFGLITWQIFKWSLKIWRSGEVSETLRIVYHPFIAAVALGFGVLSLTLFLQFLRSMGQRGGQQT